MLNFFKSTLCWFKSLKGPHILQVYLVFLILLASVFHAFAPEFHGRPGRLVREIPTFADTVASGEIADSVGKNLGWTDAQTFRLRAFLQAHRSNIENVKQTFERSTLEIAGAILVIPILAIFFLGDGEKLANQIILLISPGDDIGELRSVAVELNVMLQHYIRAKVILGISSFLFSSAAMLALGFPHPLALGLIAGILEFIPIAGWMIAAATIVSARGSRALSLDLDARPAWSMARLHGLCNLTASNGARTGDPSAPCNICGHGRGRRRRNRGGLSLHSLGCCSPGRLAATPCPKKQLIPPDRFLNSLLSD